MKKDYFKKCTKRKYLSLLPLFQLIWISNLAIGDAQAYPMQSGTLVLCQGNNTQYGRSWGYSGEVPPGKYPGNKYFCNTENYSNFLLTNRGYPDGSHDGSPGGAHQVSILGTSNGWLKLDAEEIHIGEATPNGNTYIFNNAFFHKNVSFSNSARIIDLADGTNDTDAATLRQVKKMVGTLMTSHYFKVSGTGNSDQDAQTGKDNSALAAGVNAQAFETKATALGYGTRALAGTVALGADSIANQANTVSIGSDIAGATIRRRLVNVQTPYKGNKTPQTDSDSVNRHRYDAVNVDYLVRAGVLPDPDSEFSNRLEGNGNLRFVFYDQQDENGNLKQDGTSLTLGRMDGMGKTAAPVRLRNIADATTNDAAVNYKQLKAIVARSTRYFKAKGSEIAGKEGDDAQVGETGAIAIGPYSQAGGVDSVAIGRHTKALGVQTLTIGSNADAIANHSIALGYSAGVMELARKGIAIGYQAIVKKDNAVALGAESIADQSWTISVGHAGQERRITHVAEGREKTDVVNVGQLNSFGAALEEKVSEIVSGHALDKTTQMDLETGQKAGAGFNFDQMRSEFTQRLTDIGNDLSSFNYRLVNLETRASEGSSGLEGAGYVKADHAAEAAPATVQAGSGGVALGAGANTTGKRSVALGQASVADRDETVSIGSANHERQIVHLAAGTHDTDAVNLQQLNQNVDQAVAQSRQYTDEKFETHQRNADGGTAAAIAVASLPQAISAGRSVIIAGGGIYQGQSAFAIGFSTVTPDNHWIFKLSGAMNTRRKLGAGAGVAFQW
jgi:trimeric autotransporter adhesin